MEGFGPEVRPGGSASDFCSVTRLPALRLPGEPKGICALEDHPVGITGHTRRHPGVFGLPLPPSRP